jgi:hypothetical protein
LPAAAAGTISHMADGHSRRHPGARNSRPIRTAVLALVGDELRVVPGFDVTGGQVVLTKVQLVEEVGEDVTDVEAEVLAAGLTARLPRP